MKQFLVVAYDVSDDKRRLKIAKTLEKFGKRCNYSVFECFLSESKTNRLKEKLKSIADGDDCILYYYLCKSCVKKREFTGSEPITNNEIVWV